MIESAFLFFTVLLETISDETSKTDDQASRGDKGSHKTLPHAIVTMHSRFYI